MVAAPSAVLWTVLLTVVLQHHEVAAATERVRPWCSGGVGLCSSSDAALVRYGHAMALVGDSTAYIYGGSSSKTDASSSLISSVEKQDVSGHASTVFATTGGTSRSRHAMVAWRDPSDSKDYLVVFGGLTTNSTVLNSIQVLDLATFVWTTLSAGGSGSSWPEARQRPSATLMGTTTLAIFGGYNANATMLNDVWLFDLQTKLWTGPLTTTGSPPTAKAAAGIAAVGTDFLVIYGGLGADTSAASSASTELHVLDLRSAPLYTWNLVNIATPQGADVLRYGRQATVTITTGGTLQLHVLGGSRGNSSSQTEWHTWFAVYEAPGFQASLTSLTAAPSHPPTPPLPPSPYPSPPPPSPVPAAAAPPSPASTPSPASQPSPTPGPASTPPPAGTTTTAPSPPPPPSPSLTSSPPPSPPPPPSPKTSPSLSPPSPLSSAAPSPTPSPTTTTASPSPPSLSPVPSTTTASPAPSAATVPAASPPSTTTTGRRALMAAATASLEVSLNRTALFISTAGKALAYVIGDEWTSTWYDPTLSAINTTVGSVYVWPSASSTTSRDEAAWVVTSSSGGALLVGGVQGVVAAAAAGPGSPGGSGESATVTSDTIVLNPSAGYAADLSSSISPTGSVFVTSSSFTVLRSMLTVAVPGYSASTRSASGTSKDYLVFFGSYDVTSGGAPLLTYLQASDTQLFDNTLQCTPAPTATCVIVSAEWSVFDRNLYGYSAAATLGSFAGSPYQGAAFTVDAPVLLLYGGYTINGGAARNSPPQEASASATLQAALEGCDYNNIAATAQWATIATCAYAAEQTSSTGRRRLQQAAATGASATGRRRALQSGVSSPSSAATAVDGGLTGWGGSSRSSSGGDGGGFVSEAALTNGSSTPHSSESTAEVQWRRKLQQSPPTQTNVFRDAVVGLWQDASYPRLQMPRSAGAGIVWASVYNLTGGTKHSPGPRADAALAPLASGGREMLLFGGLSYSIAAGNTADTFVTQDLHYLRYYVGGEAVSATGAVLPCPTGGSCTSYSQQTAASGTGLPTAAPMFSTTPTFPDVTYSYWCANGSTVRFEVSGSLSPTSSGQGFIVQHWNGTVLVSSASALYYDVSSTKSGDGMLQGSWTSSNFTMGPGLFQVVLTQLSGKGWVTDMDAMSSGIQCSNGSLTGCPQLRIWSLNCSEYVSGFGAAPDGTGYIWDVRSEAAKDPEYYKYMKVLGLRMNTDAAVPAGDDAKYVQYPFEQRGSYLQSYEVQPLSSSPVPAARHRHAATFIQDALLTSLYGAGGVLVLFGGTTDPAIADSTKLLADLWVFMATNHTWLQLSPGGTAPAARQGHAILAKGPQIFITGGEYYDSSGAWVQDTFLHVLDLSLGLRARWRVLDGGDAVYNSTTRVDAFVNMASVTTTGQMAVMTQKDLLLIPDVARTALDATSYKAASVQSAIDNMYDGDALILDGVTSLDVSDASVSLNAAVSLLGNTLVGGSGRRRRQLSDAAHPLGFGYAERFEHNGMASAAEVAPGTAATVRGQRSGRSSSSSLHGGSSARAGRALAGSLSDYYDGATGGYTVWDCSTKSALIVNVGAPVLFNMLFQNCRTTAVRVQAASTTPVVISNCIFYDNVNADGNGAAIYVASGSVVTIIDTVFLSNTAVNGSAVYVESGAEVTISGSTFDSNGQGAVSVAAGAVMVAAGACLSSLTNTKFLDNGWTDGLSSSEGVSIGGALVVDSPSCSLSLDTVTFSGNQARTAGGAVHVSGISNAQTMTLATCTFDSNKVTSGDGGALYSTTVYGALSVTASTFSWNSASSSGGALSTISTTLTTVSSTTFVYNSCTRTAGGSWDARRSGTISLSASTFSSNSGPYGGAISTGSDVAISVTGTTFTNNSAVSAGALECQACDHVKITGCTFSGNSASGSGGALSLVTPATDCLISSTTFSGNSAQLQTSSGSAGCGRYTGGGGGAACVQLDFDVVFDGCTFTENSAASGGGAYVEALCSPSEECGVATFNETTFSSCTGANGGGGAIFSVKADNIAITCPASISNATFSAALNGSAFHGAAYALATDSASVGCDTWYSNNASYGPEVATVAYSLGLLTPDVVAGYASNQLLPVVVTVLDYYNQTINAGSVDANAQVSVSSNTTSPVNPSLAALAGVANYTTLKLSTTPGVYNLSIVATGTTQVLATLSMEVTVRSCYLGEVSNKYNTECSLCDGGGEYTFSTANTTCDSCPDNANCTVSGYGNILVPADGYWHSHPMSAQVHECPNTDACVASSQADAIVAFQEALVDRGSPNATLDVMQNLTLAAQYWVLQCATGYKGHMCAVCDEGFGQTTVATCKNCPNGVLNAIYYFLASMINVVLIAITIKSQLQPKKDAEEQDAGGGGDDNAPKADSTIAASNGVPIPYDAPVADAAATPAAAAAAAAAAMSRPTSANHPPPPRAPLPPPLAAAASTSASAMTESHAAPLLVQSFQSINGDDRTAGTALNGDSRTAGTAANGQYGQYAVPPSPGAAVKEAPLAEGAPAGGSTAVRRLESMEEEDEEMAQEELDVEVGSETHAVVIKILVSYLQVASIVYGVQMDWPSALAAFFTFTSQVSNGIGTMVSLDCSLSEGLIPRSFQKFLIVLATPLVILALALPVWLFIYAYQRRRDKITPPHITLRRWLRVRMIITTISVIFFLYPNLVDAILGLFACNSIDSDSTSLVYYQNAMAVGLYWQRDYAQQCYQSFHQLLAYAVGIPGVFLFCVGVPLFNAWWLWFNRVDLHKRRFYTAYGFLYADYDDKYFYWDSIIMARKLFIVVVVVFLNDSGVQCQLLVTLGIILLAMIAQMLADPYRNHKMDRLERLSLYGTTLIIYIALFFGLGDGVVPVTATVAMSFILVIVNCAIIAVFVLIIIREFVYNILLRMDLNNDGTICHIDFQAAVEGQRSFLRSMIIVTYNAVQRSPWKQRLARWLLPYPMTFAPLEGHSDTSRRDGGTAEDGGSTAAPAAKQTDTSQQRGSWGRWNRVHAAPSEETDSESGTPTGAAAATAATAAGATTVPRCSDSSKARLLPRGASGKAVSGGGSGFGGESSVRAKVAGQAEQAVRAGQSSEKGAEVELGRRPTASSTAWLLERSEGSSSSTASGWDDGSGGGTAAAARSAGGGGTGEGTSFGTSGQAGVALSKSPLGSGSGDAEAGRWDRFQGGGGGGGGGSGGGGRIDGGSQRVASAEGSTSRRGGGGRQGQSPTGAVARSVAQLKEDGGA